MTEIKWGIRSRLSGRVFLIEPRAKDGAGQHEEELLRGEPEHQAHGEDAHERLPHLRHKVAYEPEREGHARRGARPRPEARPHRSIEIDGDHANHQAPADEEGVSGWARLGVADGVQLRLVLLAGKER